MNLKTALNRAFQTVGYSIVRLDTLDSLLRGANGSVANSASREKCLRPEVESVAVAAPEASVPPSPATTNLKLTAAANEPPRNCTVLAPRFVVEGSNLKLAANIAEFQERGITIIGTSQERASSWRETEAFDRDVSNQHSSWDWAGNSIAPYSSTLKTGIPSERLIGDLKELFTGDDFEAFFRGVLGCAMTVGNCRLVRSLPHEGEGVGPQSWHQDGCPPGIIRGVLYLTDVDEKTGPFQYKDSIGKEHTVHGKTGDLLVFDAMRLLHRAMPPERNTRSAIDLVFMPRLPGQALDIVVAGMNHWPADPFNYSAPIDLSRSRIL
jgi:hypothetical protein